MKLFLEILSLIIVLNYNFCYDLEITCRNESGKPIDWYSIYKLPKTSKNTNDLIKNGTLYAYITELNETWILSNKSLGNVNSLAGQTLNILYTIKNIKNQNKIGYLMYNDQIGVSEENKKMKTNNRKAHAKGVLIFDKTSVVWLIHSIPNYPVKPMSGEKSKYYLDSSQTVYGQSILCLTLGFEQMEKISRQLLVIHPQVYDSFIPNSLLKSSYLTDLNKVINGDKWPKNKASFNIEKLKTLKNNSFLAFHKNDKYDQDLYSSLIGPSINFTLFTETWSHGVGQMSSECNSTYSVYNIEKISMNKILPKFTFTVGSDHSKWAINLAIDSNQSKYMCIGDINRQESQKKRGGGSVCFVENKNVWKSYFDLIELTENCENKNVSPNSLSSI